METLETLGHQIQSVKDIRSVVTTMKGLAAVNLRQYEEATHALTDYNRSLELGMQILLRSAPSLLADTDADVHSPVAVVVIGSDQGMCGQFNSRIASHAIDRLRDSPENAPPMILAMGVRAAAELDAMNQTIRKRLAMPASVTEITRRAEDAVITIGHWRKRQRSHRLWLFYQRQTSGASYEAHFEQIIPLDRQWLQALSDRPWRTRMLPTFTMDLPALFSSLVRQSIFGAFYSALAESLAAENAARLTAMQAAEKNIDERLDHLTSRYHQRRQSAITAELLDLTAQLEALR